MTQNKSEIRRDPMIENRGYHVHVYYNPETKSVAERLRETIAAKFAAKVGGLSDEPRGPHPISQFVAIFEEPEFQNIVPWLMLNREGLDVLVHPLTQSSYDDHSKNALWLGTPVPMQLNILRPTYSPGLLPEGAQARQSLAMSCPSVLRRGGAGDHRNPVALELHNIADGKGRFGGHAGAHRCGFPFLGKGYQDKPSKTRRTASLYRPLAPSKSLGLIPSTGFMPL
jgi:aromatic ring-cleaving dioxygenase